MVSRSESPRSAIVAGQENQSERTNRNVKFASLRKDDANMADCKTSTGQTVEEPWAQRVALSLDGGGVRGLCQLLMIQKLMDKVEAIERKSDIKSSASSDFLQEHPKLYTKPSGLPNLYDEGIFLPAHYFDFFAGTGAGGIVAILLGRLRCNVKVAIEHYKGIWKGLGAGMTAMDRMSPVRHAKKANTRRVQAGLASILRTRDQWLSNVAKDNGSSIFVTDISIAKTLVLTVEIDKTKGSQKPYLFRSYNSSSATGPTGLNRPSRQDLDRVGIAQVASASCAAPRDFSSVQFEDHNSAAPKFRDGSLWNSNPALELYTEMLSMYDDPQPVGMILSIGTGEAKSSGLIGAFRRRRSSAGRVQRGQLVNVDEQLDALSRRDGFRYTRLPGPIYLNDLSLNEWQDDPSSEHTFDRLQKSIDAYCDNKEVNGQLESCAEYLVDVRRKRAKTQQWARFALGIFYTCDLCDGSKRYTSSSKRASAPPYIANLNDKVSKLGFVFNQDSLSAPMSFTMSSTASIEQSLSGPPSLRLQDGSEDLIVDDYSSQLEKNFDYNTDFVKHLLNEHAAPPPDAQWKERFDRWVADRAHTVVR